MSLMVDAFVCLLLGTDIGRLGFFNTRNFVVRHGPTGITTFSTGGFWRVSRMTRRPDLISALWYHQDTSQSTLCELDGSMRSRPET